MMTEGAGQAAMDKFSLGAVIAEAARLIGRDFGSFVRLALAPLLFCWGFSAVQGGGEPGAGATSGAAGYYLRFLISLTMTFLISAFMVSVHRHVLLGSGGARPVAGIRIARNEARYAACFIGLALFAIAAYYLLFLVLRQGMLGGLVMVQFSSLIVIVSFAVLFLCSLVLVEEALGIKTGFLRAFKIAAGNRLRLLMLGAVTVLVPLLAGLAALWFVSLGIGEDFAARALRGFGVTLTNFVASGFWVVALSLAYRRVTGWTPSGGENE